MFSVLNTVFEKMAAYNFTSRNMTGQGQTVERLLSLAGTADFFPMFGVAPAHGRVFKSEEFEPGADNVIILTDRFWARRFGSIRALWEVRFSSMERQWR